MPIQYGNALPVGSWSCTVAVHSSFMGTTRMEPAAVLCDPFSFQLGAGKVRPPTRVISRMNARSPFSSLGAARTLLPHAGGQLVSDERIIILINSTDTKAAAAAVGQCCNVGRGRKEGGREAFHSFAPSCPLSRSAPSLLSLSRAGCKSSSVRPPTPPCLPFRRGMPLSHSERSGRVVAPSIYRAEKRIKVKLLRSKF